MKYLLTSILLTAPVFAAPEPQLPDLGDIEGVLSSLGGGIESLLPTATDTGTGGIPTDLGDLGDLGSILTGGSTSSATDGGSGGSTSLIGTPTGTASPSGSPSFTDTVISPSVSPTPTGGQETGGSSTDSTAIIVETSTRPGESSPTTSPTGEPPGGAAVRLGGSYAAVPAVIGVLGVVAALWG